MIYSLDDIIHKTIDNLQQIDYGDVQLKIIVRGGIICRYEVVSAESFAAPGSVKIS